MSLFTRNIAMLAKTQPDLAQICEEAEGEVPRISTKRSKSLMRAARKYWMDNYPARNSMSIFLGVDQGHKLVALCERPPEQMYAYIVVERSLDIFLGMLHNIDLSPVFRQKRVIFAVDIPKRRLGSYIGAILEMGLLYTMVPGAVTVSDTDSYEAFTDYYSDVTAGFGYAIATLVNNRRTNMAHAVESLKNRLHNAAEAVCFPRLYGLRDKYENKPAIVIAAGPSLDKNVHLVKELKGRAVVLCANTVLKRLLDEGIKPDFVCSMDTSKNIIPYYTGIDPSLCDETIQVTIPAVNPRLYELYQGPKAIVYTTMDFHLFGSDVKPTGMDEQGDSARGRDVMLGASCGHMAYGVAAMLGCSPIILIGQDLAYGDDLATHAKNINFGEGAGVTHRAFLAPDKALTLEVTGNNGGTVTTNAMWRAFIDKYCMMVSDYVGDTINATEGGAFIEGTSVMPLQEAIDEHVSETPFFAFDQLLEQMSNLSVPQAKDIISNLVGEKIPEVVGVLNEYMVRAEDLHQRLTAMRKHYAHGFTQAVLAESLSLCQKMLTDEMVSRWTFITLDALIITTLMQHHGTVANVDDPKEATMKLVETHWKFSGAVVDGLTNLLDAYVTFAAPHDGGPKDVRTNGTEIPDAVRVQDVQAQVLA